MNQKSPQRHSGKYEVFVQNPASSSISGCRIKPVLNSIQYPMTIGVVNGAAVKENINQTVIK